MKSIIIALALLISLSSCATMFCTAICDNDDTCYTICRGISDAMEE